MALSLSTPAKSAGRATDPAPATPPAAQAEP